MVRSAFSIKMVVVSGVYAYGSITMGRMFQISPLALVCFNWLAKYTQNDFFYPSTKLKNAL